MHIVITVVVITSVDELKMVSGLPVYNQSSQASGSVSLPTVALSPSSSTVTDSVTSISNISNQSLSGILQPYSSCYMASCATPSSNRCTAGPMTHMHYGSAPAYGYSPMTAQPARMMVHPNAVCYRPSTEFQARTATSYRQMVPVAPNRTAYAVPGYTAYDRNVGQITGSGWSGNMQLPRQCGGTYGPSQTVCSTVQHQATDLPSTAADALEPVRAPASTKSKKKSRNQSKESYSSILDRSVPCPNIDVRQIIQEQRERLQMETASTCTAVGVVRSSTDVCTVPTLCATSASASQQTVVSSHNLSSTSSVLTSSDGTAAASSSSNSSLFAASQVSSTSVSTTANDSTSSPRMGSAELRAVTAVSFANVCSAVSCGSSLPCATAGTIGMSVTAPMSTGMPRGPGWMCVGAQQYNQWSQYTSHPLSAAFATKSSVGMHPYPSQFDSLQSQQVLGILPYPGRQPMPSDVLESAATMATSGVANSGWLPGGEMLPSSASETVRDESPIRLVQNMVSGLETTQNSLAIAASLIISHSDSVTRRRRSGASDVTATATAATTTTTELHDEVGLGANSESLNTSDQINTLPQFPNEVAQAKAHLPATSAVTTTTSVLTQVLPATNVMPSAYCVHPMPSTSVHPSVIAAPDSVRLISDMHDAVSDTATSSENNATSIAVSGTSGVDLNATCHGDQHATCTAASSTSTAVSDGGTAQRLTESQVIDDDESTQDCDISIAGTDSGEVLCTTGTQTSTPASAISNCNSIESGGDGSESMEPTDTVGPMVTAADNESEPATVACDVHIPKPAAAACEEKQPDDVQPDRIPVPTSTPVVLIPRVPQASFILPQNIAFAPSPLVGHGFLQFQPPGEFGYGAALQPASSTSAVGQPGALGLVHFAAGPVVGPAVGNMMTASDASGSFRLMTPVKSDGDAFSAAEFLPLMPAAMPAGHILLPNIVPTGLASTIVPFVQPAALCSLPGGNSALFAVTQGSMMSVGAPLAFASVPLPEQHHHSQDHAPDQPDSTVDNSEMDTTDERSSDDSADTEQVTSTDEPLENISDSRSNCATEVASSSASTRHCNTGRTTPSSLTKTNRCNTLSVSTSRTANDLLHIDTVEDALSPSHSSRPTTAQRSRSLMPRLKKRAQLSSSRFKNLCRGHRRSTLPSAAADQMSCSSSQSSMSIALSITTSASTHDGVGGLMSPARSEKLIDSLSSSLQTKDIVASDSSVSTTLSLNDSSNDDMDVSSVEKCDHRAGSLQKARWKKQDLARRARLRLRHSEREAKLPVNTQLSPTELSHVGK